MNKRDLPLASEEEVANKTRKRHFSYWLRWAVQVLVFAAALSLSGHALATMEATVEEELEQQDHHLKEPGHLHFGRGLLDRGLEGYDALREQANEEIGLDWLIAYSVIGQRRSHSGNKKSDVNSELDVLGSWQLIESTTFGTSSISWLYSKVWEYDDSASQVTEEAGSIFAISDSDSVEALRQFYWTQSVFDGMLDVHLGQWEVPAFFNEISHANNDRDQFIAQAFVRDPVRANVDVYGLGAAASFTPTNWLYLRAGFVDGNTNLEYPQWDTFKKTDYVYVAEIGFTPKIEGWGQGTYFISPFYADKPNKADLGKQGEGVAFGFEQELPIDAAVFGRGSVAKKRHAALQWWGGGGIVFTKPFGFDRDKIGIAVGVGHPDDPSFREPTYLAETYWRFQLTERLEFSPDMQFHIRPAKNRGRDVVFVGGLRMMVRF